MQFNGLGRQLGNLAWLSEAETRSISAENPTGGKGMGAMADAAPDGPARELGRGWKCRPYVSVGAQETAVVADIEGAGAIQSMWFGGSMMDRDFILRIYWDGQTEPSVECPLTDFFAVPFSLQNPERPTQGPIAQISSLPVAVNPNRALNCYWEMPFRQHARITIENLLPDDIGGFFYQIKYTLTEVEEERAYFHAQFRRQNPLPYKEVYTILDGVQGQGHFVGVYLAWGVNNNLWWGEGEIKFYIDGDTDFPTICGTGTEDYFNTAYCPAIKYDSPYHGLTLPGGPNWSGKSSYYRFHIEDPIHFRKSIKVTIEHGHNNHRADDVSSTAYWYQLEPHKPYSPIPSVDQRLPRPDNEASNAT